MNQTQASVGQIRQLSQIRAIHVRRAQQACAQAEQQCELTAQAVCSRKLRIAAIDDSLDDLASQSVGRFASLLPRWSTQAVAERDRLLHKRELESFALEQEVSEHGEACFSLTQARKQLARARNREQVVTDLAKQANQTRLMQQDSINDLELDDVIGAAIGRHNTELVR